METGLWLRHYLRTRQAFEVFDEVHEVLVTLRRIMSHAT
jgi:hypothetical protein